MTLNDLLRKAQSLAQQFSTGDIPLYNEQSGLEIKDIHVVYMYICVCIHTYLRNHIYIYIYNATDMYCIIRDLLTLHKHIFFKLINLYILQDFIDYLAYSKVRQMK